jgi:multiple sugar transport system permease protein
MTYVGLENYKTVLLNPLIFTAIKNTLLFSLFSTLGHMVLGFLIASGLNSSLNRHFLTFSRTLLLLPWAISPSVVAIITQLWAHPLISPVAKALKYIGISVEFAPLAHPRTALPFLTLLNVWQFTPLFMLMILAALQTMDLELDEAAQVDGASPWQRIWYITIPQLRRTLLTLILFDLVITAAYFDLIWITTQGGPARSTEVLSTFAYRLAFLGLKWNTAAAAAMILVGLSVLLATVVILLMNEE